MSPAGLRKRRGIQKFDHEMLAGIGAAIGLCGVDIESEALVIGGVAEHEDRLPAVAPRTLKSFFDQGGADALIVEVRTDADRGEGEGAHRSIEVLQLKAICPRTTATFALGDQGDDEVAEALTESVHQFAFAIAAEGLPVDIADRGMIVRDLASDSGDFICDIPFSDRLRTRIA